MADLTNPAARSAEIACAGALATLIVIGSSAARDQWLVGSPVLVEYYIRTTRASRRISSPHQGRVDEETESLRIASIGVGKIAGARISTN